MLISGFTEPMEYFEHIKNCSNDEIRELLNEVTVQETSFFRNRPQFDVLKDSVLPDIIKGRMQKKSRKINCWSAGCSTGEETVSILITILEQPGINSSWEIKVIGSDISTKALMTARGFTYPKKSFSGMTKNIITKYFTEKNERELELKTKYHKYIDYRYHNLVKDFFTYNTDIIFCCNVMIYFKTEIKAGIYHRFYKALADDGVLFIGHSETMKRIYENFKPLYFNDALVYKKNYAESKDGNE